ncbi:MAG: hypothetical protein ACREK1_02060 [Longimicrobiales bacterium]
MPADPATSGAGSTRQTDTGPDRPDDRARSTGRALDREREMGAVDTVHDRGRQPGAHGRQAPHREVKPGTQRSIEEAKPGRADDDRR